MPHRILVVDDHPLQLRVVARQLESLGHRAICTSDAQEGMLLFAVGRFDLVILGSNLDADAFARHVRETGRTQSHAACTIVAGMQAPMPMRELEALLHAHLRRNSDAPSATDAKDHWSLFERTSREDLAAARAALAAGHGATVQASLHRIKGAAQMLQCMPLALACTRAEVAAGGTDAAHVLACIDAVEAHLAQAQPQPDQPGASR